MENNESVATTSEAQPFPQKSRKKIIVVAVIFMIMIAGFFVFKSIQGAGFDKIRLNDIAALKGTVEKYHKDYKSLPTSISSFSHIYTTADPRDPGTKKDYIYEKISPTEYRLCTKFSLLFEAEKNKIKKDKNGLGCQTYRVAANLDNINQSLFLNPVAPTKPYTIKR